MTLTELQHFFHFQTNPPEGTEPSETLSYVLFNGSSKLPGTVKTADLGTLMQVLEGYTFEGYQDTMPLFVKPDPNM